MTDAVLPTSGELPCLVRKYVSLCSWFVCTLVKRTCADRYYVCPYARHGNKNTVTLETHIL